MGTSFLRGHKIELTDRGWAYSDTGDLTAETYRERPCGHCGRFNTPEGHDACLGTLAGVMNACCGHGQVPEAYVQFEDGACIYGEEAIATMSGLKTYTARRNFTEDRRICEAATPGPWDDVEDGWVIEGDGFVMGDSIAQAERTVDARFIAEARTGWPAALDEIDRLRNALTRISEHDGLYYLSSQHAMGSCLRIAKEALSHGEG